MIELIAQQVRFRRASSERDSAELEDVVCNALLLESSAAVVNARAVDAIEPHENLSVVVDHKCCFKVQATLSVDGYVIFSYNQDGVVVQRRCVISQMHE